MQDAKEKVKNTVSSAKEHLEIYKAKAEEKMEKATAKTEAEKEMARQRKEAKVHEAKMHLHESKLQHKAESEQAKHGVHGFHEPTTRMYPTDPYAASYAPPATATAYGTTTTTGPHTDATAPPGMATTYGTTTTTQPHTDATLPSTGYAKSNYPGTVMPPDAKRM